MFRSCGLTCVARATGDEYEYSSDFMVIQENCTQMLTMLTDKPLSSVDLENVQKLLNTIPNKSVLSMKDTLDLNILQKCIVCNQQQVLAMLIQKGIDVNAGECNLPLHLACKLGHSDLVQILLENGAKPSIKTWVCYQTQANLQSPNNTHNATNSHKHQSLNDDHPLGYAIRNDRDDVIRILLRNDVIINNVLKKYFAFHEASSHRALKSIKVLAEIVPEKINENNNEGLTALQYVIIRKAQNVVHAEIYRDIAHLILESIKDFMPHNFDVKGINLLEYLYNSPNKYIFTQLTKLILEKGPPGLAKSVIKCTGTLLHYLVEGCAVIQNERDLKEVTQGIEILTKHGCDPNNRHLIRQTVLHALFKLSELEHIAYTGPRHFENIYYVMKALLKAGSDVNALVHHYYSPMHYLMDVVCSYLTTHHNVINHYVIQCFSILCEYGANPDTYMDIISFPMTLINENNRRIKSKNNWDEFLFFTGKIFLIFYGQQPYKFLYGVKNVKFLHTAVTAIPAIVKRLILSGQNPNFLLFESDGRSLSSVGVFFIRCISLSFLSNFQRFALELLDIFRNTLLDPRSYAQFVKLLFDDIEKQANDSSYKDVQQNILEIYEQPRSLKQLCRIEIYNTLQWQIDINCKSLSLPPVLVKYLKCID